MRGRMQIKNVTRKTVIVKHVEHADSYFSKMVGLMFRSGLAEGHGMLMTFDHEGKHSIWMMCMRFPIDIVYIGKDMRVVGVEERFRPLTLNPKSWKISKPEEKCLYVLEVAAGVVVRTKTVPGDRIEFSDKY